MTLRRRSHGWLALVAMLAAPAWAEPPPNTPQSPPDLPALHGTLALSLGDAIKMGLENNLDVEVERFAPFIASEERSIAWGFYDPEFFGNVDYADIETPNAFVINQQTTNVDESVGGGTGIRGFVPLLGSTYNFEFTSDRSETNSTIQALSPDYDANFNLRFTQPLLRNLIWSEPWTRVSITRIRSEAAAEEFRTEVMNAVLAIADGYWNLIAAHDQVRVAEKSLETAAALLNQTKTQHEVGVVSKVEVVEAEAGVAAREFDLIVAENRYRNAQDQVIDLVLGPHLAADSTLEFDPTDRPEDYVKYEIDAALAVERAFANRPELAVLQKEIERDEISLKFAKNQRLPQVDATVSYGNQGLAGEQNPNLIDPSTGNPLPPGTIPSSGYTDVFNNPSDQLTAGVMISIPLPNTSARHRVSQAELELRRALTRRRRLEQSIILEVRKAVRDLKSAQEGIEAAERRTVAASEQLRAEEIRLEYGESTPFDVLLRDRDLVDAESQEIVAFQTYRTSATGLDRAQGTILRSHNIAIDQVRQLR
jgi:outer membrane protein TolC